MYIQREETKQVFILPRVCKGEEEEYRTMPYTNGEHGWESNVWKDPQSYRIHIHIILW